MFSAFFRSEKNRSLYDTLVGRPLSTVKVADTDLRAGRYKVNRRDGRFSHIDFPDICTWPIKQEYRKNGIT